MPADHHYIPASDQLVPHWKRVLDFALIAFTLPLVLFVGGIVALIIRVGSHGPIIFRQERIGHLGKPFTLLKFRTMQDGADTSAHQKYMVGLLGSDAPMFKLDARGDGRIIFLGTWIRAAGLDELPQLINVLWGEMSLVGPRPCLAIENTSCQEWQKKRFDTLPGLTGLWQVSGKNNTTFQKMIQLDLEYSRTKTLALDLEIIMRTIPVMILQILRTPQTRIKVSATPEPA